MEATIAQTPHSVTAPEEGPQTRDAGNPPHRARTRTVLLIVSVLLALFAIALIAGVVYRFRHNHALASATAQAANTPVRVYTIRPVPAGAYDWSLPATTQAIADAVVYARVSGYLSKRYVDLGDTVKAGQLLAEIQSPELDQQLNQARANLQQSYKQLDLQKANLELARTTMERYKGADKENAVAKLTVDQSVAGYATAQASVAAAEATVASNEANVRQYEAMTAFERVLAPFDGIITQRNVDIGALITAGSPTNNTSVAPTSLSGAATGLFEVSQIDTLRIFVSVPQVIARNVKVGMPAQVAVRGSLTTPVSATVTRTASALDPGTRMLLTEVDIPNSSHGMLAGEFVYVNFNASPVGKRWDIPATALIFNAKGTQLMLVGPGNALRLQKVIVGRDFGDRVEIHAGVTADEAIVEQPDVSLQEGQVVTPIESPHGSKD